MLQWLSHFLRSVFQGLRPASFPHTEQAQPNWMQDMKPVHAVITGESDLKETGPLVAVPRLIQERSAVVARPGDPLRYRVAMSQPGQERNTEPYRAIRCRQRPAERYRKLDAMLAEIRKERLLDSETVLLPVHTRQLAQRLYRELEQEAGNGR